MTNKTIKMLIPLKGLSKGSRPLQVETEGFTGESCREATAALEEALGMNRESEELTEEYHATEERREYLQEGGGDSGE